MRRERIERQRYRAWVRWGAEIVSRRQQLRSVSWGSGLGVGMGGVVGSLRSGGENRGGSDGISV